MGDPYVYVIGPAVGVVLGYIGRLLTTKRERRKSDMEIIDAAISPLVGSIKELTEQNRDLVCRLTDEQQKALEYIRRNRSLLEERDGLIARIDRLTKQVELLKKMLREHLKETSSNDI